jgi:RNA polymerase sigma-70 factor (TIGR02957 family)
MTDDALEALRPRAFAVAYRMLGSVADAEDVVQEALLRVHRVHAAGEEIAAPEAFVTTVATRLALDRLRSARAHRETYVGEWLPEPIVDAAAGDPGTDTELAESLSLAFLVLLERLSPEQRAVFLLHDVFGNPYDEIARLVGKSEAACRQLVVRARRHIRTQQPRFEASRDHADALAERFLDALRAGDVTALETLLAEDVELHGDGGGRVPALTRPVAGRRRVAATLASWMRAGERVGGVTLHRSEVNGQPGALTRDAHGRLVNVFGLDIADGRIRTVRSIVNPDKLRHLGPVTDVWRTLRDRRTRP